MRVEILSCKYNKDLIGQEFAFSDDIEGMKFLTKHFGQGVPSLSDFNSILNHLEKIYIDFYAVKDSVKIGLSKCN